MKRFKVIFFPAVSFLLRFGLSFSPLLSADLSVSPISGPYFQIQSALDAAQPGDRVLVTAATYHEQLVFPRSGNASSGWITLQAAEAEDVILDGSGFEGGTMILIQDRDHIRVQGLTIQNLSDIGDGGGIRIQGACNHVQILDCIIQEMNGTNAMGITVYGTSTLAPISNLLLQGNTVQNCEPSPSEAITLNGNVTDFQVLDNIVAHVNNIGIDFIGGETDINPDPSLVARNGLCARNQVTDARSNYGGGYAAGIYVDGGRDIVLEANVVTQCDLGIEIGAENAGTDATGIIVRSNRLFENDKAGLVFGGYDTSVGRTRACFFLNNTLFRNDQLGEGVGELWIQFAEDNVLENNIAWCTNQGVAIYSEQGNLNNALDYNLWYGDSAAGTTEFVWNGEPFTGFAAFQAAGHDMHGSWADPQWISGLMMPFEIDDTSPAFQAGTPTARPEVGSEDMQGDSRIALGRIDIGADEYSTQSCYPAILAFWRQVTSVPCGGTGTLTILHLAKLIQGTCACP